MTLEHVFIIQKDNLELPLNVIFEIVDGNIVEITTQKRITDNETKKKYENILKRLKENSVFPKER